MERPPFPPSEYTPRRLHQGLDLADSIREEASNVLRDLIDEIRLSPDGQTLRIEIFGELASLIALAQENPRSAQGGVQGTLVAGARYQPFRTPVSAFVPIPG